MSDADGDVDRRDPTEDANACSRCGVYIGSFPREEYCESCAREVGAKPPMQRCMGCGRDFPEEEMKQVDVSPPDEYYPTFRHLCRDCSRGEP